MEESLEELEARLYSQVYHDTNVEPSPETSDYMPLNLNRQSNKRYWQKSKNISTQNFLIHHTSSPIEQEQLRPKTSSSLKAHNQSVQTSKPEIETVTPAIKTFVPYSSVLSFMSPAAPPLKNEENKGNNYEKKKNKAVKFPKNGKMFNPLSKQGVTKGKSAMKFEIQAKKQKAIMARKKAQSKVVTTIDLDDSDESDCIPIEQPPPLLITLDSSDDEEIRKKRALSPSTSSIISDDFIVAGDKRRLANPFKSDEIAGSINRYFHKSEETLKKVKALLKAPSSSSSSDSARSSCERNINKEKAAKVQQDQLKKSLIEVRQKRKSSSMDNSNEDSIYGMKAKIAAPAKRMDNASSGEEQPCVSTKSQKMRRRKSISGLKKSTLCGDPDDKLDEVKEPKIKQLVCSTPLVQENKRSRFITPSYNDDEFASMISEIIDNGEIGEPLEESCEDSDDNNTNSTELQTMMKEPEQESVVIVQNDEPSVIEVCEKTVDEDCKIIEKPIEVVEVPDEDDRVVSDSDNSMCGFKLPIECDISLNVTQVQFEPHEFIKAETSQELTAATYDDTVVNPEIGWNDEMKFYYDGSWGDKNFCISTILDEMPRDQKLWRIGSADRNRTFDSGCRVRCRKCNEIGHYASKCMKPKKRVVCFMCGEEGHRETRCPNSICLGCGKPNRLFATVCTACHKMTKRNCPLCSYQGHDIEQCPDKWRRYHSTTTETGELNNEYRINERVYCSICARRGHFAENCNQFLKMISGMITSSVINIVSHKPSFPKIYLNSVEQAKKTQPGQQQLLALYTYFPYYRFNFQFARGAQIYRRFLEQFRLHKQRQQNIITAANHEASLTAIKEQKRSRKKLKRAAKQAAENEMQVSTTLVGDQSIASNAVSTTTSEFHDDSNSNYSFSEFYKQTHSQPVEQKEAFKSATDVNDALQDSLIEATPEKSVQTSPEESLATVAQPKLLKNPFALALPEFIPLSNDNDHVQHHTQIVREPEQSCEAKILLTKENFKLLKNDSSGQNFLFDLQSRLNVIAEFQWDITGIFLSVTGLPSNQSMFHLEVREYLYRAAVIRHEKLIETSSQLPKAKASIICFIKTNLGCLNKLKCKNVKQALEAMFNAEKTMDHKKALKWRKTLNIAFIGSAELGNGREHIGALRRIVRLLEKEMAQGKVEISQELREEIMEHMKPIFSTMDHGDYRNLFNQYLKTMKHRKKQNLLQNPI